MKRISSLIVIVVLLTVLSSCAPRGETSSVDQIFNAARSRFDVALASASGSAESSGLSEVARAKLGQVTKALDVLVADGASVEKSAAAQEVQAAFSELLPVAGYTSRPTLAELGKQYETLAEGLRSNQVDSATVKLAAMRAYTVLASELETTKFAL